MLLLRLLYVVQRVKMASFSFWAEKREKILPSTDSEHQQIGIGTSAFPIEFQFGDKNNENGVVLHLTASEVRFLVRKLKLIKERHPEWLVETEDERKYWTPEVYGPE